MGHIVGTKFMVITGSVGIEDHTMTRGSNILSMIPIIQLQWN